MNKSTKNAFIGITIASLIGLAGVTGFLSTSSPASAPVVQAAPEPSASSVLAPPTTAAPADVQRVSVQAPSKRVQLPSSSQSTTTTSEKPAALTAEQEATIGAGLKASDEAQEDAREHMSDATDYDLPYATTTTIPTTETTQP